MATAFCFALGMSDGLRNSIQNSGIANRPLLEDLQRINTSKFTQLRSIMDYQGPNGLEIKQRESGFLYPQNSIGALYTDGASTCVILILVARNNRTIQKIGLAHIDEAVTEEGIREFYAKVGRGRFLLRSPFSFTSVDAYVISGEKDNALKVLKVLQEESAQIRFFNADLNGLRSDSALVDREGHVYIGSTIDLLRVASYLGIPMTRRREMVVEAKQQINLTLRWIYDQGWLESMQ